MAEPINGKQFVTGAIDTFLFDLTGEDYSEGGIPLALPKGYVAIVGLVNVKGALPATVTDLQVVIADGAAKLKALDAAGAEVVAEALSAQAVVFAKKG